MDDSKKDALAILAGAPTNKEQGKSGEPDGQDARLQDKENEAAALREKVNSLVAANEELRVRNKQLAAQVEQVAQTSGKADTPEAGSTKNTAAAMRLAERLAKREEQIRTLLVRNAVASSKFIREKTLLPPGVALDVFSRIFTVEEMDGKLVPVAHLPTGEPIMSRIEPGKPAGTEEALEIYILNHFPERDSILRGGAGGSGAGGNQERRSATPGSIARGDSRAFSKNLEAIAAGTVSVV